MSRKLNRILLVGGLAVLCSCKPSIPRDVIDPDDMEDILYDYHLADAAASLNSDSTRSYNARLYQLAVLKKHGVTEAEFDSSMVYYTRHTEKLYAIYEKLAKRMGAVPESKTADDGLNRYSLETGEAANVWNGERCYAFIPTAPFNKHTFIIPVDSSYHKGDRIILEFDAQFLYQDGVRDGIAIINTKLSNDSVITRTMHMSSSMHYSLEVFDDKMLGIKDIRGLFYLNRDRNATVTTTKVMVLNHIRLMRLHEEEKIREQKKKEEEKQDSVGQTGNHMNPQDNMNTPQQEEISIHRQKDDLLIKEDIRKVESE